MESEEVIENIIDAFLTDGVSGEVVERQGYYSEKQNNMLHKIIQHIKEQDETIKQLGKIGMVLEEKCQVFFIREMEYKERIAELEEQLSDWEDKYEDCVTDFVADMALARREH